MARLESIEFHFLNFFWVILAGVAFGLTARLFIQAVRFFQNLGKKEGLKAGLNQGLRPMAGGLILLFLFQIKFLVDFEGLSLPMIQNAMQAKVSWVQPLIKGLLTALSVGSGFKGGEFIPLVVMGTTLGSALSALLPVSLQILSALGFSAIFSAASKTPVAGSILAIELFGSHIAPYAFVVCFVSHWVCGRNNIYSP